MVWTEKKINGKRCNFLGIIGKLFTRKKHELGLNLFESFSQLKLKKIWVSPSLISIMWSMSVVWQNFCQCGMIDNIEDDEHSDIIPELCVDWNFQWSPFSSHSHKDLLSRCSTTWSRMVTDTYYLAVIIVVVVLINALYTLRITVISTHDGLMCYDW